MTLNQELKNLEQLLNKHNESLKTKDGEYKSVPKAMESIHRAWERMFTNDKVKVIHCIAKDSEDYKEKG